MSTDKPSNTPMNQELLKQKEQNSLNQTSAPQNTENKYPYIPKSEHIAKSQPCENAFHNTFSNTSEGDTKSHLLATGYKLLAQKGFTAVGIKLILDTAGIPKGSFYHYFASKEAFGEAVIRGYFDHYKTRLDLISNQNISAQQKLHTYFQYWYDTQQNGYDHEKCLVVKLSGEVADISEPMREALSGGYQQTINWISQQVQAGWKDGSLPPPDLERLQQESKHHDIEKLKALAAQSTAKRWYYAWLGASLIAKTSQSDTPLQEVWQITVKDLGYDLNDNRHL